MKTRTVDFAAATAFITTHGRLLDRRRFEVLFSGGSPEAVFAALDGYRNPDGGYGCGLEPDLRAPGSQPLHALHAFEALVDCAPATSPRAVALCDWLASVTFDDGGLPFVLPISDGAGCAPWFISADSSVSSLHGTTAVVAMARELARHHPAVAAHPWLSSAVRYCLGRIARLERPHAYELLFSLRLLDGLREEPEAANQLRRLATLIPPSGLLPVEGGIEGERLKPLDLAPVPGTSIIKYLPREIIDADLDRLVADQQSDGGWRVDFNSSSPAGALEWRGFATVRALAVLRAHGRLQAS